MGSAMMIPTRPTYHHGDLRNSLIKAALDLVAERGVEGFSLREAARTVGVSASACYRHFADRADLDAAVRKGLPTAGALKQDLMALADVLGVLQADPQAWFQGGADEDLSARIDGLVAARDAARASKDWPEADRIRAELTALNVEVMDGPAGATWRIKEQA